MDYQEINSKTIDRWVDEGWEWGVPIDHETYIKAKNGEWDVFLTPTKPVPHEWPVAPAEDDAEYEVVEETAVVEDTAEDAEVADAEVAEEIAPEPEPESEPEEAPLVGEPVVDDEVVDAIVDEIVANATGE